MTRTRAPGARAGIGAVAALVAALGGCRGDVACISWDDEATCPARSEAIAYFQSECGTTLVSTVLGDAYFDDDACCYEVRLRDDREAPAACPVFDGANSTDISAGAGPVPPSGSGGANPATTGGGGEGGAGGAEPPGCLRCWEVLETLDPATPGLCPDSVPLVTALRDCTCTACTEVCDAVFCSSTSSDQSECAACALRQCDAAFNDCSTD